MVDKSTGDLQNGVTDSAESLVGSESASGILPKHVEDRSVAIDDPEVFIGLVGPIGTEHGEVVRMLCHELEDLGYRYTEIRMSKLLHDYPKYRRLADIEYEEDRFREHMKAGTEVRKLFQHGSALAQMAISKIWRKRAEIHNSHDNEFESVSDGGFIPLRRHAFIFNSLKNPEEVSFLRKVYGQHFYLLAIHTPREQRVNSVSARISKSHFQSDPQNWRAKAEELVSIDENEDGEKLGQDVRGTYPEADFFIVAKNNKSMKDGICRFIRLVFQDPFVSPNISEISMFYAKAAAWRSSDLSRQIGAVIVDGGGRIISTGCNEVPRAGGGQYWTGDVDDYRDFQLGFDSNARLKDETLIEILGRLRESGLIKDDKSNELITEMIDGVHDKGSAGIFEGARVTNVIEFGRMIHAEMAAITQAAQHGASTNNATLYCTTFPCHMCARHIIASGIKKVFYIEPYPKSLAKELYSDSVTVDADNDSDGYVSFLPFEGAAPRRFHVFFEKFRRKDSAGRAMKWNKCRASPKADRLISLYPYAEQYVIRNFKSMITQTNLDVLEVNPRGGQGHA